MRIRRPGAGLPGYLHPFLLLFVLLIPLLPAVQPATAAAPAGGSEAALVSAGPYVHLLEARDLREAGDVEGARAELDRARALDPGLVEPHLARARLDLAASPSAALDDLLAAATVARARFAAGAETLLGALWGVLAMLLVALTLVAVAHAAQVALPLHHLLTERLARTIDPRLAAPAAALLLALPLVWGAGPLATALALLLLAGPARPRGARALAAAGGAAIVVLGLAPGHGPAILRPTDFNDKAQVLDLAEHAPLTPALADRLQTIAAGGADLALLVHGNALRRAGRPAEAAVLLERYAAARPEDPRGPLALGNLRLAAGDPRGAAHAYRRATALDPALAEPHVNLALAHSALMQFELANAALAEASRLDPARAAAVAAAGARGRGAAPLELGARPDELWGIFRAERAGQGLELPPFVRLWLPWQGGAAWPLALLLLAAAWAARRPLAHRLTPFPCSVCGRQVCRRCVTRRRGLAFCRGCQRAIGDVPAEEVVRLLVAVERRRTRASEWVRRAVLNLAIPGHGLVVAGRSGTAALLLGAIAATWVGLATGGHPVAPLPAVPVGDPGLWGGRGFGLGLAIALCATAACGLAARPRLGAARRGRIVPLAAEPFHLPADGRPEPRVELRSGTDG